jgi:hypothetical protein
MNGMSFDTLTRETAGSVSRRTSLGILGAAGLAAVAAWAGAHPAAARKQGKTPRRGGKSIDRKANQKCAQQKAQCFDALKPICNGDEDCGVDALRCCPLAGECDVIGFFLCIGE